MSRVKWRNLTLFVVSFVVSFVVALVLGRQMDVPVAATIVFYGLGVWPCAAIIKLEWLE